MCWGRGAGKETTHKELPCCFLRHITVKRVANAEMTTSGTVMATALMGPAHGECTGRKQKGDRSEELQQQEQVQREIPGFGFFFSRGGLFFKHKPSDRFSDPMDHLSHRAYVATLKGFSNSLFFFFKAAHSKDFRQQFNSEE